MLWRSNSGGARVLSRNLKDLSVIHHQFHVRAQRLPRQPQALQRTLRKVRLVQAADPDLDAVEAPGSVAEDLDRIRACAYGLRTKMTWSGSRSDTSSTN
jgi:hypothetical protein